MLMHNYRSYATVEGNQTEDNCLTKHGPREETCCVIGHGSFSEVVKIFVKDGQVLACKVISNSASHHNTKQEIDCLRCFSSYPSIVVPLLESIESEQVSPTKWVPYLEKKLIETDYFRQETILVMPYFSGGDLHRRLSTVGRFQESDVACISSSIARFLIAAQVRKIMHRDLKLENILLASEDSNSDVRVADFGLAREYSPGTRNALFVPS